MLFGAILAGGVGSRMNIDSMPKQFLPLGSKPIFMHTLEKFLLSGRFDAVYLGVHADWVDFVVDSLKAAGLKDAPGSKPIFMHTLEKFLLSGRFDAVYLGVHADWVDFVVDSLKAAGLKDAPVRVVKGGADRNGTIMSIIEGIESEFGSSDDHIVVTHDSVRPFVKLSTIQANIDAMQHCDACDTVIPATDTIVCSEDDHIVVTHDSVRPFVKLSTIQANIDAMQHCDACDTVIPATDTIVCSDGGEFIDSIPVRSAMFQGQTPQTFRINALKQAFSELTEEEKGVLTDACKMFVLKGRPVAMVQGDVTNIKLTTIMDYKVAQAMLDSEEKGVLTDACKMFVLKGRPVAMVQGDVTNIKLTTIMDYKVAQAMLDSGVE